MPERDPYGYICWECADEIDKTYLFHSHPWVNGDCEGCGKVRVPRVLIDRLLIPDRKEDEGIAEDE